jgi:hypothetical protein
MQNPTPIALGNMRVNGVRTLTPWCLDRTCNHFRFLLEDDKIAAG